MNVLNILFCGILGTLISTVVAIPLGIYYSQNLINYRRYIKVIRKIDRTDDNSFFMLMWILSKCQECNPSKLSNFEKFYKSLRLDKFSKKYNIVPFTLDDIKLAYFQVLDKRY